MNVPVGKFFLRFVPFAVLLTAGSAFADAVTNDLYVAEGETKQMTELIADMTITDGMTLRKTGPGILLDDTVNAVFANTSVNIVVAKGVWKCTVTGLYGKGGKFTVEDGACLYLGSNQKAFFKGAWNISLAGRGTGVEPYLGAVVMDTAAMDAMFSSNMGITLTDDTTIYGMRSSYNSFFFYTTLNMQGHTLTLKGKSGLSPLNRFRPRYDVKINNPGTILVDNCIFDFHYKTTYDVPKPVPLVKFVNGAQMASFPNDSLWGRVDTFDFEPGCAVVAGYNTRTEADVLTMKRLVGAPTVPALMTLTIGEELVARTGDLNGDKHLQTENPLTFAEGSQVKVIGFGDTGLTPGTVYTLAESAGGIEGMPTASDVTARFATLTKEGNALKATIRSGVVDSGFLAGAENAAANTARAAELVGSLNDGDVVLVRNGEYSFTGGVIDLSSLTARSVTILGDAGGARLKATLKLGAAADVMVVGVTFAETAGPAVVAENTSGLTVADCVLDHVAGAYAGVEGAYPFVAVNVTDLDVHGLSRADATSTDATVYSAQAYLSNGSQKPTSEVFANAVTIVVPPGVTQNWATAKAALGLTSAACSGQRLRLLGGGTFAPETSLADEGIAQVEIGKGVYLITGSSASGSMDDRLGVAKGPVYVRPGGSLVLVSQTGRALYNRTLNLSGAGVSPTCGAVHFSTWASWERAHTVTWNLDADTTITSDNSSMDNGTFLYATINVNGHDLTLKGGAYRFGWFCSCNGGGRVIVDGATVTASSGDQTVWPKWTTFKNDAAHPCTFFFRNGARLMPDSPELLTMINDVTFETPDCTLGAHVGSHVSTTNMPKEYVFKRLAGVPTVVDPTDARVASHARSISITVTNCYGVLTADLLATPPRALTVPTGNITFSPECRFTLDNPAFATGGTYTLAQVQNADAVVTGRPRALGATDAESWGTRLAADHKALLLRKRDGLMVSFR